MTLEGLVGPISKQMERQHIISRLEIEMETTSQPAAQPIRVATGLRLHDTQKERECVSVCLHIDMFLAHFGDTNNTAQKRHA